jgi:tetratricopeptide (TPR) repeat protein
MRHPIAVSWIRWLASVSILFLLAFSLLVFSQSILAQSVFIRSGSAQADPQVSAPDSQVQADPHQTLQEAVALEKQGGFEEAIRIARQVIESGQLTGAPLGRAYIVLGAAYRETGEFAAGQKAFEQSLEILGHDGNSVSEYASALENYAGLYNNCKQFEVAVSMWKKALRLRLQIGEHEGAMQSLVDLAGAALVRHRVHEASKYLSRAEEEAELATDVTDDSKLFMLEVQGWLAVEERNTATAVADYKRAIEISMQLHGERHWLTGWEYMLLSKAYAQAGEMDHALWNAQEGLEIIEQGVGTKSPEYFAAEISYSQLLDRSGAHLQAARLKADAEQAKKEFYGDR